MVLLYFSIHTKHAFLFNIPIYLSKNINFFIIIGDEKTVISLHVN